MSGIALHRNIRLRRFCRLSADERTPASKNSLRLPFRGRQRLFGLSGAPGYRAAFCLCSNCFGSARERLPLSSSGNLPLTTMFSLPSVPDAKINKRSQPRYGLTSYCTGCPGTLPYFPSLLEGSPVKKRDPEPHRDRISFFTGWRCLPPPPPAGRNKYASLLSGKRRARPRAGQYWP